MLRMLNAALAALLVITPGSGVAQQHGTSAMDALLDRFMGVLPDTRSLDELPPPDPALSERLNALNPGREDDVRSVLSAHQACLQPVVRASTLRALRHVGRSLGETKLRRLVEFYEGSDLPLLTRLQERSERGETLSESEIAEMGRILADYPLTEFYEGIQSTDQILRQDRQFMTDATRCAVQHQSALAREGLRRN